MYIVSIWVSKLEESASGCSQLASLFVCFCLPVTRSCVPYSAKCKHCNGSIHFFLADLIYWKRNPRMEKTLAKSGIEDVRSTKKLSQRDEFLLTLIRLRLGLLNEDLAE